MRTNEMIITPSLAQELHQHRVFFRLNSPPPSPTAYGWLPLGKPINLKHRVSLESYVGLYKGPYTGSVGGGRYSGLCSIGSFSYSYSPLPEPLQVGRYCSISSGLSFLDSHHPTNLLTTSIITFRPQNPLVSDFVSKEQTRRYKWHRHGERSSR